jgi:hypothetical protein
LELISVFTGVLMVTSVVILTIALFSQSFQKIRARTSPERQFNVEPPEYFRRYRAVP